MRKPSTESENKPAKKKYVPPAVVDYGSVTKITATPKVISTPDQAGGVKKGSCL
jgi:hypothetical protein